MFSEEDKIRWEFLRRNPYYKKDYLHLQEAKLKHSHYSIFTESELCKKWAIKNLVDPEKPMSQDVKFNLKLILARVFSKSECIENETSGGYGNIEVMPPFPMQIPSQLLGDAKNDEERFSLIIFDLKMFPNVITLQKYLNPILTEQFDKYNNEKNPNKAKYDDYIFYFDKFLVQFEECFNKKLDDVSDASLKKYLSTYVGDNILFKTNMQNILNIKSTSALENSLESTFSLVRRAPCIAL